MGQLLKNPKVLGGAVAGIGLAVMFGVYTPDGPGMVALEGLVALTGGAAVTAAIAFIGGKIAGKVAE